MYLIQKLSTIYFHIIFFIITNNEYIQKEELIPQAEFYKGIYYLHKEWTEYKNKTNQPIINKEESLNKTNIYKKYANKGDMYYKKDY